MVDFFFFHIRSQINFVLGFQVFRGAYNDRNFQRQTDWKARGARCMWQHIQCSHHRWRRALHLGQGKLRPAGSRWVLNLIASFKCNFAYVGVSSLTKSLVGLQAPARTKLRPCWWRHSRGWRWWMWRVVAAMRKHLPWQKTVKKNGGKNIIVASKKQIYFFWF